MDIKILTPGCCTSHSLQDRVHRVIDGEVQVAGRSPTVEELEDLLVSS